MSDARRGARDPSGAAALAARRAGQRLTAAMSTLRSLLFLLFQLVVTPLYAVAMLATFWLPRVPRYRWPRSWCSVNLWGAR